MTLIIIFIVYSASALATWKFMNMAHSANGRWWCLTPGRTEILLTIMPLVNTITAIIGWLFYPPKRKNYNANKFFKVKKN